MMLSFRFYVSAAIFATTLFLVIKRPKNIGIGYSALIGAAASYALGLINLEFARDAFSRYAVEGYTVISF